MVNTQTGTLQSGQPVAGRVRRGRALLVGILAGLVLAVVWSAKLVDTGIGQNIAKTALGHDARTTPIGGLLSGAVFAFVTGVAGSFTACNIAVFGAVGPHDRAAGAAS